VTVGCSIGATVLLIAPVSMHRLLFRQHSMKTLVTTSHGFAIVGTVLLGVALAGVAVVIFDTVVGRTAAWFAGGCTLAALAGFWYLMPLLGRNAKDDY
jgi:hypothetical protein